MRSDPMHLRTMIARARSIVAGTIIMTACTAVSDSQHALVRDSAGVRIIENTSPAWNAGDAWRLSSEPLVRIGAVDSEDQSVLFSWIIDVGRLSDGRIVVLEGMASEVRWFDSDGRHLMTRGRRGEGPGEFNTPRQMLVLHGDTILVRNTRRMKNVLYSGDGELLRDEYVDMSRRNALGQWTECPEMVLPDRSLLGCQGDPAFPAPPDAPGHFRGFDRFKLAPPELDTAYALGVYGGLEQWGVDVGGRTRYYLHAFYSSTKAAAGGSPVRIAMALNPEYSIELWTPDGRLERIVRRMGARHVPTPEDRQYAAEAMRTYEPDDARRNRALAEMQLPDSMPAVGSLLIAPDGHLWVERRVSLAPPRRVWDVFDASGRFQGEVAVPNRLFLKEIGSDYVIGLRLDDYDVTYIEMYELLKH